MKRLLFEETLRGNPEKALALAVMVSPELKGLAFYHQSVHKKNSSSRENLNENWFHF